MVLILALAGSALAGVPMHAGEQGYAMTNMPDCCKAAQSRSNTPAVEAARLCCALNCSLPGTPVPSNTFKIAPALAITPDSAVLLRTVEVPGAQAANINSPHGYQQYSNPAYIRHLALLI